MTQEFPAFSKGDISKYMESMNLAPVDLAEMVDISRKNMQTLVAVQQMGLSVWQDMIQRTQKIAQDIASEQAQIATSVLNEGTPEEKIARATDRLRKTYDRTHAQYKEIAALQHELSQNLSDLIARRIKENLSELGDRKS